MRSITAATIVALASMLVVAAEAAAQSAPAPTPPPTPPTTEEIARGAARIVNGYGDLGTFSGAVLIAKGDEIVYKGAAGLANPEFDSRNTPDTPFRVVNFSQLFTVAAVLRLQERGKLNVADPAAKYFPDWPDTHRAITIHQLLAGPSGIKDVSQMPDFVKSVAVPRDTQELAALILKEPLGAAGGSGRANNSDYHLLAAIVERVAGISFNEHLRREIFVPLGLTHTRPDVPSDIVAGRAAGLMWTPEGVKNADWFHMNNAVGRAHLLSTTGDLHLFLRALRNGRLISRESLARMTAEHVPGAGPGLPGQAYGLTVTKMPRPSWRIGGSINGFTAGLVYDVDTDVAIVVLSNISNGGDGFNITNQLNALVAGRPFNVPLKRTATAPRPQDLAALAGTWNMTTAVTILADGTRRPATVTFRSEGTRLFISMSSGAESEWFAEGPGRFFARHTDAQVRIDELTGAVTYVAHGNKNVLQRASGDRARDR